MKSRTLFFLGITLLVAALVLAIVTGLITPDMLTRPDTSTAQATLPVIAGGQSAREAFEQVMTWAGDQDLTLEPVSISIISRRDEPAARWTFLLYQAEKKKLWIVNATPEGVQVLRERAALYAQRPFAPDVWTVDSDTVVSSWWAANGETTWSDPEAHSLSLHLGQDASGALAWTVAVLDQKSQVLDVFRIDAETGDILPLSGGPS